MLGMRSIPASGPLHHGITSSRPPGNVPRGEPVRGTCAHDFRLERVSLRYASGIYAANRKQHWRRETAISPLTGHLHPASNTTPWEKRLSDFRDSKSNRNVLNKGLLSISCSNRR